MKISKQARRGAKQLFRACQADGLLDENRVRKTVQQLIAQKPRAYLPILSQLGRLVKLDIARRTAKVESATPLSEPMQASVRTNLDRVYGRGLTVSFTANASLIGGLRIQVGSDVYDGSVQARLASLQENF